MIFFFIVHDSLGYTFPITTQNATTGSPERHMHLFQQRPLLGRGRLNTSPLHYTETADRWKPGASERAVSHIVLWLVLKYVGLPSQTVIRPEAALYIYTGGNTFDLHQMRKGQFFTPTRKHYFFIGPWILLWAILSHWLYNSKT